MIEVQDADGIRTIMLSRPDKRNAMTPAMLDGLSDAASGHDAHVVLLLGEGRTFCAGFDLTACRDDDKALPALLTGLSHAIRALRTGPAPVVIGAHGAAIAGGCALLGAGDIVITNNDAKLGYPVVRLGISPAVSAPTSVATCGDRRTRELMLDPKLIDGATALRMGLVAESLAYADGAIARAREVAQSLAAKPPGALARTKLWLNEVEGVRGDTFDAALEASLALVDGEEGKRMLAAAWTS